MGETANGNGDTGMGVGGEKWRDGTGIWLENIKIG